MNFSGLLEDTGDWGCDTRNHERPEVRLGTVTPWKAAQGSVWQSGVLCFLVKE